MKRELLPLTGLRGIAAYAVLIAHAIGMSFQGWEFTAYFEGFGYFGMSLFFVLSGFVMHYNYAALFQTAGMAAASRQFFLARFARLYPLYFVVLVLSVAYGAGAEFTRDPWAALACLTLTQSWFGFTSSIGDVGVFSWSVSTEAMLYVLFALLILPIEKIKNAPAAMLCVSVGGFLVLALLFVNLATVMAALGPLLHPQPGFDPNRWLVYFSPYLRCLDFFLGVLASKVFLGLQNNRPLGERTAVTIVTAAAGWCVLVVAWVPFATAPAFRFFMQNIIFAPAIATALIFLCRYQNAWWSRLLSRPTLLFAGAISYSVYLLQVVAFVPMTQAFKVGPQDGSLLGFTSGALRCLFMVGLATVLGYGSYLLIERPARDYLRARRPRAATTTAPVANAGTVSLPA